MLCDSGCFTYVFQQFVCSKCNPVNSPDDDRERGRNMSVLNDM